MGRYIFFDIDGTLLLSQGAGQRALAKVMAAEFSLESPRTDIDYGGRTDRSIAQEIFQLNGLSFSLEYFDHFMDRYVKQLKNELEVAKGDLCPGVMSLLNRLHELPNYHLGLITGNIQAGAKAKLEAHGIADYFHFGGFGDRQLKRDGIALEGKVDAERYAQGQLDSAQLMVIGDTPHDVTCSRAIGAACIGVSTGYAPRDAIAAERPELLLNDFADLEASLANIDKIFAARGA